MARRPIYAFLLSPAIVPTIITAIGLYFFFVRLKATGSILAMALGHTVLALPVVPSSSSRRPSRGSTCASSTPHSAWAPAG